MKYDKYIGLPYQENGRTEAGVDCWGLARLYYKNELNIELPSYSELYDGSLDASVIELIKTKQDNWAKTTTPIVGDICLFNIYNEPRHIGIYIGDGKFLHSRDSKDSVIESINSPQWAKRFAGYYTYVKDSVEVVGAPHPLRTSVVKEWTAAGTTIADFVGFVNKKYKVSKRLAAKFVVMVDGIVIPKDKWDTTVLQNNQKIAYKTVAEGGGGNPFRTLLVLALVVVVSIYAPGLGETLASEAGITSTFGVKMTQAVVAAAMFQAGAKLIDAIAPIRTPSSNDPGSANGLNLFNGTANQVNRFGAIPVVLGKVRYTGLLGATPYIETLTDTNIIHLLIVWGFGPLDISDICSGGNDLTETYYQDLPQYVPRPVTLYGESVESTQEVAQFNSLYPQDVEQSTQNSGLLTWNQATNQPGPWRTVSFNSYATSIDIAFNFPEGMRRVLTKGDNAGKVEETTAVIEIQTKRESDTNWTSVIGGTFTAGNGDVNTSAFKKTLQFPPRIGTEDYAINTTYCWYTIYATPGGGIDVAKGAITDNPDSDPSSQLIDLAKSTSYVSIVGNDATYSRLPTIPPGSKKLYNICISSVTGYMPEKTVSYITSGSVGLQLSPAPYNDTDIDSNNLGTVSISVTGGRVYDVPTNSTVGVPTTIFTTSTSSVPGSTNTSYGGNWSELLKANRIWVGSGSTMSTTVTVNFPVSAYYEFEASVDDTASIYIDGSKIMDIPKDSWRDSSKHMEYIEAGQHSVTLNATDSGGERGIALKISYTLGTGYNIPAATNNIITIGTGGFYSKRKDAFNWVYKIKDLPKDKYQIRVRRINDDTEEPLNANGESTYHNYHKAYLYAATAYNGEVSPHTVLPKGRLAKTAIRIQSSSRVSGQVDGINALVQTRCWDWDKTSQQWKFRTTNNPASLFLYVLMHPANAYAIADQHDSPNSNTAISSKVDLNMLQSWHEYCDPTSPTNNNPKLTYNSVVTETDSVMNILRNICAAGKASPTVIDGKWSVVIDRPRTHAVQHFTTHNSWGFESSKMLPKLPDAFRVTIPDEEFAYQANELHVYNYGKNESNSEIFEQLSLPGVTNKRQAYHLARWHMAQLKLRPEVYTLNTDFEYLVCTRGDLVRVSHDVPMWGTGSGRIKSINGTTITLSEQVYLEPGKSYRMLVRTNNLTSSNSTGTAYININPVTDAGYYDQVIASATISSSVELDNLYSIGELYSETQELIVLKVEPSSNNSARITLVDYSPEIYTADLENDLLSFNPNITKIGNDLINKTITKAPIISNVISTRGTSQEISTGTFQTTAIVSFTHPSSLTKYAEFIQVELIQGSEIFNNTGAAVTALINKNIGTHTFTGIKSYTIYKIRARYVNSTNNVFGPWSDTYSFIGGAAGNDPMAVPSVSLDLNGTFIVASVPSNLAMPSDFKAYEYRLYKDTGTEDFWDLVPDSTNNIKVVQSSREGRFDLREQTSPKLSASGITYRVACRSVNNTNQYSDISALGTIVIKTIQ